MILQVYNNLLKYYARYPVFGVILFTEAHPHIVKVLKDREYYAALNEISGDYFAIFASLLFRGTLKYPSPQPGVFHLMFPIWEEPSKNKELLYYFGESSSKNLPLFVLFGGENSDFYYHKYPIKLDSVESAFRSLEGITAAVVDSINLWDGRDKKELFSLFKRNIDQLQHCVQENDYGQYHIQNAETIICNTIQKVHYEVLNMSKISVTLGNGNTFYGDFIVAKTIENSFNKAAEASVDNELKQLLTDLVSEVGSIINTLPKSDQEQLARDLENLTAEATSEEPRKQWWELSIEGIKQAAHNLGEIGLPIIELATKIAIILSKTN